MSTIIYPSPIFGPIHSRRLGISLGINLLPGNGKICTFDCIYCECGFNKDHRTHNPFPTREEVREALSIRLEEMKKNGSSPDVLTFAGNGEPTIHPHFPDIIEDTLVLRNQYFPNAHISVLSNSTRVTDTAIREALMRVDNPIMKLDTVDVNYIQQVDRPTGHYNIQAIIEGLKAMNGHAIIQTMFMKGITKDGVDVNNTIPYYIEPWLKAVEDIAPRQVMIYTIDRETPEKKLQKASPEELNHIVSLLKQRGIQATASY